MKINSISALFLSALCLSACTDGADNGHGNQFSSSGFGDGMFGGQFIRVNDDDPIEVEHACTEIPNGQNQAFHVQWGDSAPNSPAAKAAKRALIVDDETSPCGQGDKACVHWAIFNIPGSSTEVNFHFYEENWVLGQNYKGETGYAGMCPPSGTHTYKFTVFALSADMPDIPHGAYYTRSTFYQKFKNHIVGYNTKALPFTAP